MILGPFLAWHGMVSHLIQAQEVKRASATRVPLAHSNLHFHGVKFWLVEICCVVCNIEYIFSHQNKLP